jgi:Transposase DDE domain
MDASIEHQMTEIYCFVDDYLRARPALSGWRRSPHSSPRFTDAEVITIALLQGPLGVASLKKAYRMVAKNWRSAFPRLPSYAQWIGRLHQLTRQVGALLEATCGHGAAEARLYLMDSKPIPLCHALRHGRVRLLREDGARFGKSSKGWFFGFKLHAVRHIAGRVMSLILTPANWDDRDPALALCLATEGGAALGDQGYRGEEVAAAALAEAEVLLLTVADGGGRGERRRALLSSVRERVETTFSLLWGRFVDRVFSRSWAGLWSTIKLKLLHYNLAHAGVLTV